MFCLQRVATTRSPSVIPPARPPGPSRPVPSRPVPSLPVPSRPVRPSRPNRPPVPSQPSARPVPYRNFPSRNFPSRPVPSDPVRSRPSVPPSFIPSLRAAQGARLDGAGDPVRGRRGCLEDGPQNLCGTRKLSGI